MTRVGSCYYTASSGGGARLVLAGPSVPGAGSVAGRGEVEEPRGFGQLELGQDLAEFLAVVGTGWTDGVVGEAFWLRVGVGVERALVPASGQNPQLLSSCE